MSERKLSKSEKNQIANKINYFRTLPKCIRKMAGDLEASSYAVANFTETFTSEISQYVNHDSKSLVVNGRVMVLNCS